MNCKFSGITLNKKLNCYKLVLFEKRDIIVLDVRLSDIRLLDVRL